MDFPDSFRDPPCTLWPSVVKFFPPHSKTKPGGLGETALPFPIPYSRISRFS